MTNKSFWASDSSKFFFFPGLQLSIDKGFSLIHLGIEVWISHEALTYTVREIVRLDEPITLCGYLRDYCKVLTIFGIWGMWNLFREYSKLVGDQAFDNTTACFIVTEYTQCRNSVDVMSGISSSRLTWKNCVYVCVGEWKLFDEFKISPQRYKFNPYLAWN
jgi:hypothetical protein